MRLASGLVPRWYMAIDKHNLLIFEGDKFVGSGPYFSVKPEKFSDPETQEVLDAFPDGFNLNDLAKLKWPSHFKCTRGYFRKGDAQIFSEDRHIMERMFPGEQLVKRNPRTMAIDWARAFAIKMEQWFDAQGDGSYKRHVSGGA